MRECLTRYFETKEHSGLLIAEVPTGYGKTHDTVEAIYDYIHSDHFRQKGGRVIFTTTLLKNLPDEEFRRVYAAHGRSNDYTKEIIVLPSNLDGVKNALANGTKPPFEVQTEWEEYQVLTKNLKTYENLLKQPAIVKSCPEYLTQLDDDLRNKYEPDFQKRIRHMLKKDFPGGKAERQNAIRSDKKYQWIADFYPGALIDDYKVVLMSVRKLMFKNSPIVEPSYPFLSERFLKGSIVCIDEFDATKRDILDVILNKAYHAGDDYIKLFLQIRNHLREHHFSDELLDSARRFESRRSGKLSLEALQKEAEEIYQNFHLEYSFKTANGSAEHKKNFLFHDNSYHSVLQGGNSHIRAVTDHTAGVNRIYLEDIESYRKNHTTSDLMLQNMLRKISTFLKHFQFYIRGWSECYAETVKNRRDPLKQGDYSSEFAFSSVCQECGISKSQQTLLMSEFCRSGSFQKKKSVFAPDLSVYEQGFRLFELTDRDEHESMTKLQYIQVQDTPEKILLFLCQNAKVVGLSATAGLDTVIGNYHLSYLKEQLGERFHTLDEKTNLKIKETLEQRWNSYRDGRIRIRVKLADAELDRLPRRDWLNTKVPLKNAIKIDRHLENLCGTDGYSSERYCELIAVMAEFWRNPDMQSLLCLQKTLPAENKPKMDENFIKEIFSIIKKANGNGQDGEIVVLRGGNDYENQRNDLMQRLSDGEKLFIMSSYQTIGAGQNLQYPVSNPEDYIHLAEAQGIDDKRVTCKDIDAIYLGDITHTVVNLNGEEPFHTKDLLTYCFQAECLYQNDELSANVLNQLIKAGCLRYAGATNPRHTPPMQDSPSARRFLTRDVIQAIGRLNRTFLKKDTVWIFTTKKVLSRLEPDCLDGRLLCPEVEELLKTRSKLQNRKALSELTSDQRRQNQWERIANRCRDHIYRVLGRPWEEDTLAFWKELRNASLMGPRPNETQYSKNVIYQNYYFPLPPEQKSYHYIQNDDFANIFIDLNADKLSLQYATLHTGETVSVREVSEAESRLQDILSYPGMRAYFQKMGYAVEFGTGQYIMCPVLFHNIYKGALGEAAGRYLLEHELGISLEEITNPEQFELFDYKTANGNFIDFKHWKGGIELDGEMHRRKVLDKLERANGGRAYIINILKGSDLAVGVFADGKVIEIPWLIDNKGNLNAEAVQYLGELK